jgi:hypothetical protein
MFPCEFITPAGAAADHQPQQERIMPKKRERKAATRQPKTTPGPRSTTEGARGAEGSGGRCGNSGGIHRHGRGGIHRCTREADTPAIANLYRAAEKGGLTRSSFPSGSRSAKAWIRSATP